MSHPVDKIYTGQCNQTLYSHGCRDIKP